MEFSKYYVKHICSTSIEQLSIDVNAWMQKENKCDILNVTTTSYWNNNISKQEYLSTIFYSFDIL